jgi:tetratricopeptide (TPR) repeat protein
MNPPRHFHFVPDGSSSKNPSRPSRFRFRALRRASLLLLTTVALIQAGMPGLWAHGDLHLQILNVTEAIEKSPRDPSLYIKRGDLHRLHQEFDLAMADFDTARSLAPDLSDVELAKGRLLLDVNWPVSAKGALDRFILAKPDNPEGYNLRAHAFMLLDKPLEAADDYSRAIQHSLTPGPELYIERSRAWETAGPEHLARALGGLDEGIRSLGPLVTLELPAIELERKQKNFEAALQRLEKVSAMMPRKETWLKRRGEILLEAGRPQDARSAFEQALKALQSLPPSRRFVPAMVDLEKSLRVYLEEGSRPQPPK